MQYEIMHEWYNTYADWNLCTLFVTLGGQAGNIRAKFEKIATEGSEVCSSILEYYSNMSYKC